MPFGSNTVTYAVQLEKDGSLKLGAHGAPRTKAVKVLVTDPPAWWNEYLLAEWKRKNGIEQKRRDSRTGWQRAQDEWAYQQRNHESGYRLTSTGMPRHEVWT
jgi:hypothetical protein